MATPAWLTAHFPTAAQHLRTRRLATRTKRRLLTIGCLEERICPTTVAFWQFEEGTAAMPATGSILDSSGNNHTGTAYNQPVYEANVAANPVPLTTAANNLSLQFDGTDGQAVDIPDSPAFYLTQNLTIEAFIRPTAWPSAHTGFILFRGDNRHDLDPYLLGLLGQTLRFRIYDASNNTASVSTTLPTLNQWYDVAGVLNGSTGEMDLYVNGTLVDSTTTTIRPLGALDPTQSPGVGIGMFQAGGGPIPSFPGFIDEVRLSDEALGSNEFLDAPPDVSITPGSVVTSPAPINESGTTTVSGSYTDGGGAADATVNINWGDGNSNTILPREHLQAVYPFDGNANDASGNGYNGALGSNPPTFVSNGYQGGALSFNQSNNNYVTAPVNIGPSQMPQVTFGGWFDATTLTATSGSIRGLLSCDNGGFDRTLDVDTRGGTGLCWSAFTGSGVLAGSPVVANQWTFVAVRYNQLAGQVFLDVDGQEFSATGAVGSSFLTTLTIGRNPNSDLPFDGLIDNVFVYNYDLSYTQLMTLRAEGMPAVLGIQVGAPTTQGTFSYSHQYLDNLQGNAPYPISVSVISDADSPASASTSVEVDNVVPTVSMSGPTDGYSGVQGQTRTFTLGAADASSVDAAAGFTYTINWGDGTSSVPDIQTIPPTANNGTGLTVDHVFTSAGTYTVTATATDKDNGISTPVTLSVPILAVEQQGAGLAVGGTTANDAILFTPTTAANSLQVTLNKQLLGTFTVTAPVQIFGQAGTDKVTVNGASGANTFTVNGATLALNSFTFQGNAIEGWTLVGKGTSDTLDISSVLKTVPVAFTGAAGASNTVAGSNAANTWTVSSAGGGSLATTPATGTVTFKVVKQLLGGTGVDVFKLKPTGSVQDIQGNGGADWLDYSAFPATTGANVDLTQGQATGVGSGAANAISGIVNVRGGAGNDTLIGNGGNILVGGSGNDTLTDAYNGSSSNAQARSLLLGGLGGDTLTAGSADDILISSTTSYDSNNTALLALLKEWQSSDSYTQRFDSLQGLKGSGTGSHLNGSYKLIWGATVKDDTVPDTLMGAAAGAGLDWFFASYPNGTDNIANFDAPGDEYLNNAI